MGLKHRKPNPPRKLGLSVFLETNRPPEQQLADGFTEVLKRRYKSVAFVGLRAGVRGRLEFVYSVVEHPSQRPPVTATRDELKSVSPDVYAVDISETARPKVGKKVVLGPRRQETHEAGLRDRNRRPRSKGLVGCTCRACGQRQQERARSFKASVPPRCNTCGGGLDVDPNQIQQVLRPQLPLSLLLRL